MIMEKLSKIATIYETLGKAIQDYTDEFDEKPFDRIPIKWNMVEITPNNLPPVCVIFSGKTWREDETGCNLERQLDISITCTSKYPREIMLKLSKYSEDMKKLIDELVLTSNIDLTFLQGSEIGYLKLAKQEKMEYKNTGTVFDSIIVLSYLLRY